VCVCVCVCVSQDAASHWLCGKQQLKDLLLCEISRLTKYPLLIDNLLKHTQRMCTTSFLSTIDID